MNNPILQFGWHKGEVDFSISSEVCGLSYEEMNELRSMIVVGLGTFEDMWRREQEAKYPTASAIRED
jgi:hypothetical protein